MHDSKITIRVGKYYRVFGSSFQAIRPKHQTADQPRIWILRRIFGSVTNWRKRGVARIEMPEDTILEEIAKSTAADVDSDMYHSRERLTAHKRIMIPPRRK